MSAVASMGRLKRKKRGIQMRFKPSWMVKSVAPCCKCYRNQLCDKSGARLKLYLGQRHGIWVEGRHSSIPSSISRVAHKTIENCPYRTKDLRRRSVRRLFQGQVCVLSFFGFTSSSMSRQFRLIGSSNVRLTMKPMLVPKATGRRMERAGCSNNCPGRVREGM